MKIAIMQPYFMPYIGYFQLLKSVDKFIIYDDVNFIKQGWINRNRILINGKSHYLTLPVSNVSSYKKIQEIEININHTKLLKTIELAYCKAPQFKEIFSLIESVINYHEKNLSKFVIKSILTISNFLDIKTKLFISSDLHIASQLSGQSRIIKMCRYLKANDYYNPIGGSKLYCKDEFLKYNIQLKFIKSKNIHYKQWNNDFVESLSIIDVLMFNSKQRVKEMINQYELI